MKNTDKSWEITFWRNSFKSTEHPQFPLFSQVEQQKLMTFKTKESKEELATVSTPRIIFSLFASSVHIATVSQLD